MWRAGTCAQAYLLMRVDAPGADLAMPSGMLDAAHATWLESTKRVRPTPRDLGLGQACFGRGKPLDWRHFFP